jgi:hypothetical protein
MLLHWPTPPRGNYPALQPRQYSRQHHERTGVTARRHTRSVATPLTSLAVSASQGVSAAWVALMPVVAPLLRWQVLEWREAGKHGDGGAGFAICIRRRAFSKPVGCVSAVCAPPQGSDGLSHAWSGLRHNLQAGTPSYVDCQNSLLQRPRPRLLSSCTNERMDD